MTTTADGLPAGVICDLDGVVYRGGTPIPDAVAALNRWHEAGVAIAFVTNNSVRTAAAVAAKLVRMGVPAAPDRVFDAATATADLIARRWPAGTGVFAIGEAPLLDVLADRGLALAGEDAAVVVVGFDYDLTYAKLRTATRAALAGAAVVVTNPDVLTPDETGFEPCVGATLAAIAAAVPAIRPVMVGKPEPHMVLDALARLGTDPARTVMIGDQVRTDVAAGKAAGVRTIQVTTGVPAEPLPGDPVPDFVVASLAEIGHGAVRFPRA